MNWKNFFSCLAPGWFLQWGVDNAFMDNPDCNVVVRDEDGLALCGRISPDRKGEIVLIADNSKIYKYHKK